MAGPLEIENVLHEVAELVGGTERVGGGRRCVGIDQLVPGEMAMPKKSNVMFEVLFLGKTDRAGEIAVPFVFEDGRFGGFDLSVGDFWKVKIEGLPEFSGGFGGERRIKSIDEDGEEILLVVVDGHGEDLFDFIDIFDEASALDIIEEFEDDQDGGPATIGSEAEKAGADALSNHFEVMETDADIFGGRTESAEEVEPFGGSETLEVGTFGDLIDPWLGGGGGLPKLEESLLSLLVLG